MTQTTAYAVSTEPLPAIGRALQVDALLIADLATAGTASRLTASLFDASDGRTIWSHDYTVTSSALFDVERTLVADLTASLGVPPAPATASDARPANAEAYDLFLRARYHAARVNAREIDQAIVQLERATALDPNFAPAQALLAFTYGRKAFNFSPDEPELVEMGFAAVAKALALDPNSAEALTARGALLWQPSQGFPAKEALSSYRAALTHDPDLAEAWQSVSRDAYPANWIYQKSVALIGLRRYDDARKEIEEGLQVLPNDQGGVVHSARALLAAVTGNRRAALANAAEAERIGSAFGHFTTPPIPSAPCTRCSGISRLPSDGWSAPGRISLLSALRERSAPGAPARAALVPSVPKTTARGAGAYRRRTVILMSHPTAD